jgi:hypothetical protein
MKRNDGIEMVIMSFWASRTSKRRTITRIKRTAILNNLLAMVRAF